MLDSLFDDMKDADVHDDAGIASFLTEHLKTRLPLDKPQWKVYFKEDFTSTESLLIGKIHHCLTDGLGYMLFLNTF